MLAELNLVYHQGPTLCRNISRYVKAANASSLLDIGAGSPAIALQIAKLVDRYCGVESHAKRAMALREAGLDIIEDSFPVDIEETFDFVLSSHSIPENNINQYPRFLSAAVERARRGGTVLIVTFKGNNGEVAWLARHLLNRKPSSSPEREIVESWFAKLGGYTTELVNSYVEARDRESLAQFLWPWLTGHLDLRERLHDALLARIEARYLVRDELYVFPTEHLFISHKKSW
jgi:SAM-dependent methyltransferase